MKKIAIVINFMMIIVMAITIEANNMKSLSVLMHKMWPDIAMKISMMSLTAILTHIGIWIKY